MRPKKPETTGSTDLFRARLDQIINLKHELAQLAGKIDWDWIDGEIAPLYSDKGRPGIGTRFAIGLLLLKHIYGLSDEGACDRWVHDPYFQYFTGEEFFQHEFPHERSDLSHWRKRFGDKLELLLAESLRVAHTSGALRTRDLARVTVDTTVQPKAITFPTDAKLLHAAIKGLNRLAQKHGVRLRQSYLRIAKRAAMMAGRYAHAKQFKRHHRELRLLRTRLGRIIRDIRRKIAGQTEARGGIRVAFVTRRADPLTTATSARMEALFLPRTRGRMHRQRQGQLRPMSSGSRPQSLPPMPARRAVSSCCTPRRCPAILTTATPCAPSSRTPKSSPAARSSAPMSTRDTAATMRTNPRRVFISGQKRGVFGAIKRELKRRSAIEAVIGHMKADGHLGRCYLKGREGDAANAILTAVGHNLRLVLTWLRILLRSILYPLARAFVFQTLLKSAS